MNMFNFSVTKTNLSVHEDKNKVTYVKVSCFERQIGTEHYYWVVKFSDDKQTLKLPYALLKNINDKIMFC